MGMSLLHMEDIVLVFTSVFATALKVLNAQTLNSANDEMRKMFEPYDVPSSIGLQRNPDGALPHAEQSQPGDE